MRSLYAAKPAATAIANRLLNAEPLRDSGIAKPDKVSEGLRQRRRPLSVDAWHCLRGAVERQHTAVKAADPLSPRVRPTLSKIMAGRAS
jgi:hypothetical protein